VVGPSGSGKSTLALALSGLIPGDIPGSWSGTLEVDGIDVGSASRTAIAGRVGVVFQDPGSQLVMDTVEDDVAFGLESRGWAFEDMHRRVPEALADVGLAGLERRRSTRLSGGEQQRLALAGAMAPRPGVLVLDEPTANLDPTAARALFDRLAALRTTRAATIVLVEQRVESAWPLADLVLALDAGGRPIDVGPPAEVLTRSRAAMDTAGIWLPDQGTTESSGPADQVPGAVVASTAAVRFCYAPDALAVDGVDLALRVGERVALMGPNGSGKSTLGRLLVGLLRAGAGSVRLGSADPSRLPAPELARRAGYVFQDPERQFLARTVEEEVRLGLPPAEQSELDVLMERLDLPLETFGSRSPYRLSGGEQRRLSLVCVLVRKPALLVLDEPTFGQDRLGYEALLRILGDRVSEGTCVLAMTHDVRFASDFATRRLTMTAGRVLGAAA
jgi:energy-coupling factor transporter ATP-binding protein EcfA2